MAKAALTARADFSNSEFLAKDQKGRLLVHSLTSYETNAGKFGALNGEIVTSEATAPGTFVQKPGTKVKIIYVCNGKYADMGMEKLFKAFRAIYAPADEAEQSEAMIACFGSGASGLTKDATDADRKGVFFGARGLYVDFKTSVSAKSAVKRKEAGKEEIVNVGLYHVSEDEQGDFAARAAKLPEVQ